ncbi:MAG: hypothetical protein K0R90_888 [Oscillospiraceae bacterium]|nr:hypothetical protein [Oscillospiraceae bacterium]
MMSDSMKSNIIEELYLGNISPIEKEFKRDSHYAKLISIIAKNEKMLIDSLCGKEETQFSELMEAQSEVLSITALETFTDGFKLGAKIILDTFVSEQNKVFKDIC